MKGEKDEYQTPPEWIERFDRVLGGIGLDPCYGQIGGERWAPFARMTWVKDALDLPLKAWEEHGPIFMNPPYSNPAPWADRLSRCHNVPWIALTNTQSASRWWHTLANASTAVAFPRRRISFINPKTGQPMKGNRYDQTIFVSAKWPAARWLREHCLLMQPFREVLG